MSSAELDAVDRGILHLLQEDARNLTPVDIARRLPVSEGTVRNRIERLEDDGVIRGYVPTLDYEAAGFPLKVAFTCTAPVSRQAALAESVLDTHRVVNVQELVSSRGNVRVVGVATDLNELMELAEDLIDAGLVIEEQTLMRHEYTQPFNHFGEEAATQN
ncbi:Lrp/AsnC family transcriptional regulator [Halobacterium wangiae]|uniref:Lrp/AsnC family transcriptional regulator n=1 Tax=Halobacterium wangiae TaxID=2902623 RepID=UPI001E2EF94F|nr:Lrp/AsnC family transcriptional regulator [Halobacterium wangiae]